LEHDTAVTLSDMPQFTCCANGTEIPGQSAWIVASIPAATQCYQLPLNLASNVWVLNEVAWAGTSNQGSCSNGTNTNSNGIFQLPNTTGTSCTYQGGTGNDLSCRFSGNVFGMYDTAFNWLTPVSWSARNWIARQTGNTQGSSPTFTSPIDSHFVLGQSVPSTMDYTLHGATPTTTDFRNAQVSGWIGSNTNTTDGMTAGVNWASLVASTANVIAGANPVVPTYTVSGTISGAPNNSSGIAVNLGGATTQSTFTGSTGVYGFYNLVSGSYAVTPTLAGCTFTPAPPAAVTVSGANATQDFTAACAVPGPTPAAAHIGGIGPSATGAVAPLHAPKQKKPKKP
jgi:hypothetical protein